VKKNGWKFVNKGIQISLIKAKVGQDKAVRDAIEKLKGPNNALYFKILGRYDLVEFLEFPSFEECQVYKTHEHLIETASFPCFCWDNPKISKDFCNYLPN